MNFEQLPSIDRSLDDKWFERFERIGSFQAYEYYDGDKIAREQQKEKFLHGEIDNPTLDYPKLSFDSLRHIENELISLKSDIIASENNEIVKQTYRWKINEKIAEVRMLMATLRGDMRRFKKYTEFIYGKIDSQIFSYTIDQLRKIVLKSMETGNEEVKKIGNKILEQFQTDSETQKYTFEISDEQEAVALAHTMTDLKSVLMIEIPQQELKYSASEIKSVFEDALFRLKADGWSVVIDAGSKTGISVNQEKKSIQIPESRTLSYKKLYSLIAHEIGTHVARRINGERSVLKLLALGLDRYEEGEEGVATMREQIVNSDPRDFAGFDGYLAIGLATGADGISRDFRDVYNILYMYFYFRDMSSGKDNVQAHENAQNKAWNRAVRTYRGTDCKSKGVCFTKDMVYRKGSVGVWDIVKNNPDEMMRFNVGKYDPSNERHIWVLDQLSIGDTDLTRLED